VSLRGEALFGVKRDAAERRQTNGDGVFFGVGV